MPALERISDAFESRRPVFSFEFFPPKTEQGFKGLYETIADLKRLEPGFVSVTWGAGGSTRRKTVDLVVQIQGELGITAMAHLSCVGSGRAQLAETLDRVESSVIRNVLPLGGDQPEGYVPPPDGFTHASELVEFIRARPGGGRFCSRISATSSFAYDRPSGCGVNPSSPSGGSPRSAITL